MSLSQRRRLLIAGDGAASLLAACGAPLLWGDQRGAVFTRSVLLAYTLWCVLLGLLWLLLAQGNDYYNWRITAHLRSSLTRLIWITLEVVLIMLAALYFVPEAVLPRRFALYNLFLFLLLLLLWRTCRLLLSYRPEFRRRALIVGTGEAVQLIWQTLKEEAARDYVIVGCVTSIFEQTPLPEPLALLGTAAELPALVQQQNIAEVINGYGAEAPGDMLDGLTACSGLPVAITPLPRLYEELTGCVPLQFMAQHAWPLVLLSAHHSAWFQGYLALKRVSDVLLALLGLALFAPMLPLLAIAIKLDSPGPVFYSQHRVGLEGNIIRIVKLRSMIEDAEKLTGPLWAAAYDTRVTRFGRIMRKLRLDEVPQLLNVLFGQMSLVGPRPERPEFVALLNKEIPYYSQRLLVKPGLTGWAQIRYPYGNSTEGALQKLQYDLYYIRHQSFLQDAMILMRTISTVLRFQGT